MPSAAARSRNGREKIPFAGENRDERRMIALQQSGRINEVLEAFLRHEAPERKDEWRVEADAERRSALESCPLVGLEPIVVDAVGHDHGSRLWSAEPNRATPQVLAARGHPSGAAEHGARRPLRQPMPLGDEDVRPMQADDQRTSHHGADDTSWHDPVCVHDGRACLTGDPARRKRPGCDRKRRRSNGRAFELYVGLERGRVPEDVQARERCVAKQVKVHGTFRRRPVPERMPRRHDVHMAAARGEPLGDRLHEGADGVSGEPRVGRGDEHDAADSGSHPQTPLSNQLRTGLHRPIQTAPSTISVGSISGMRYRSCGKNTR